MFKVRVNGLDKIVTLFLQLVTISIDAIQLKMDKIDYNQCTKTIERDVLKCMRI